MPLTLTVLGNGGPIANARRASSGYVVAIDGVARDARAHALLATHFMPAIEALDATTFRYEAIL